jgi:hypothetical protein
MAANAAITAGDLVEYVVSTTTPRVRTNLGTNKIVGIALDSATNQDDILRVLIITPTAIKQNI